jgi:Tol biopolymer transport system component
MPDLFERLNQALAGRYRLQHTIGQGGMAIVYLAEDLKHGRLVAVKVLRPELALAPDRFLREIEIVARLIHPHIVPLLDSGDVEGIPYYVMPYLPGESLRGRLQRERELPAGDAVRILRDVVEALAYAHGQGLIHRDIKPENVLLAGRNAVVTDFGIARAVRQAAASQRLTTVGVALGTPEYMAPEQAAGEGDVDHRADLYAVGILGYEMVSGTLPFGGRRAEEVLAAQVARPAIPPAIRGTPAPPALVATIMRCLEKRPEDRWRSAEDLLVQLEALLTPTGGTTPAGPGPVPATRAQVRRWRFAAIAAGVLMLVIGAELMLGGRKGPPVSPVERQLTFAGNADMPRLSPDGQFFAYRVYEEDRERLMVQQVSGGPALEVGSFARLGALPQWSPDGSQLLYSFILPGRIESVGAIVSRLGGASQPVPVPAGGLGAWLPERSLVAMGQGGELELTNLGTGEASRRILVPSARILTNRLAWSPRGDLIAVVSADPLGFALRTVSLSGARQHTLVERQPQLYTPQWSDDGRTLYFAREERDGQSVWRVRLRGDGSPRGEPELVLPGLTGLPARRLINAGLTPFTISSDGTRLLHARVVTGSNLWLIRLDRPGTRTPITTGTSLKRHPSVSPDGKEVIFAVRESGRMGAFRTALEGGPPHRIGALHDSVGRPVWSPAGDRVAVSPVTETEQPSACLGRTVRRGGSFPSPTPVIWRRSPGLPVPLCCTSM